MSVIWTAEARDWLADIYVTLPLEGQRALAQVVAEINARLAADPLSLGESRGSLRRRTWFVRPLVVQFDVRSGPAEVVVFHVNRLRDTSAGDAE